MTDKRKTRPSNDAQPDSDAIALPSSTGLASIFDEFLRPFDLMEPLFQGGMRSFFPPLSGFRQPNVEVQDRGDHFSVTAELPGYSKDDVDVTVGKHGIELKADKSEKKEGNAASEYQTSSRSYFYQYLTLPESVNVEKIGGTMKNGILELKIPKLAVKRGDSTRRVDLK